MLSEMISLLCGLLAAFIADRYRYNTFLECKSWLADDIPYIILAGNLLVYLISNSRSSAISLLFIINFFLMVVSDLHEQSFDTCLLVVPLATGLMHFFQAPNTEGLGQAAIFLAVLVWLAFTGKMGSGDVWHFLLLSLNFSCPVAVKSFLLASCWPSPTRFGISGRVKSPLPSCPTYSGASTSNFSFRVKEKTFG